MPNPLTSIPIDLKPDAIKLISNPIHVEIIAIPATGAAVASTIKANFCLDTLSLSITGLIIGPTINEFA